MRTLRLNCLQRKSVQLIDIAESTVKITSERGHRIKIKAGIHSYMSVKQWTNVLSLNSATDRRKLFWSHMTLLLYLNGKGFFMWRYGFLHIKKYIYIYAVLQFTWTSFHIVTHSPGSLWCLNLDWWHVTDRRPLVLLRENVALPYVIFTIPRVLRTV
jgi:hypothetical protein